MYTFIHRSITIISITLLFLSVLPVRGQEAAKDSLETKVLDDVVVIGTRTSIGLHQSPVSVERLGPSEIRQSAQPSFFDAIQNMKGLQVITPSLGFKVINARGFANTTNVRFVQMVDGIDNQAPHIGAPIANSLGPSDLDILRVEVVPGSSSAMYGMNAINGIANFTTKDPFVYQGISINQKVGVNNVNSGQTGATVYSETSLRIGEAFNNKWAYKINGTFVKGTDWYADNRTDLNPSANVSTGLTGEINPGADRVNIYGDESGNRRTLTLGGKQYVVSRTGYAEKEMTSYGMQNVKGDGSVYFRPSDRLEFSYTYKFANQNNIYQRTNRFRLENYLTQQHVLQIKSNTIQFKAFLTRENTGSSYNIRSMGENVDRTFKSDNIWFSNFSSQFNSSIAGGSSVPNAMAAARASADQGRYQPGSSETSHLIDSLKNINNWDYGAALRVKANLIHADFQQDLSSILFRNQSRWELMYGLDFRTYIIVPDGNYFVNPNPSKPNNNIDYWKVGGFIQSTVGLLENKLKINAVVRVDKNEYFDPTFNPRVAAVYSPTRKQSIRLSAQNGYRFPSIFEAFSNINSGGRRRVGGLPVMSNGVFENSYTQASITAFQRAVQTDVNTNGYQLNTAIVRQQSLLQKNPYTYLKPEHVTSFEAGYRTSLFDDKLNLDIDVYYNKYENLMAQLDANIPRTQVADSIPYYLQNNSRQNLYRLWTNSKTVSYNYGGTLGVSYLLSSFNIGGNFTYARLERTEQSDGLEDGFNTPMWTYNLFVGNPNVYKGFGFNINYRQQPSYLWQSALATGTVEGYSTIDAQVSASILENQVLVKLGATNLLNQYYYSFIGGPSIGGFYYVNVFYNLSR